MIIIHSNSHKTNAFNKSKYPNQQLLKVSTRRSGIIILLFSNLTNLGSGAEK